MKLAVLGCSICGPGLPDWATMVDVLDGRSAYDARLVREPAVASLPPNERRRLPPTARLALGVGLEALQAANLGRTDVATVFTSCGSDGEITHRICEGLAQHPPQISPTRFHNSVHNAPAGYWSIALGSRAPSTSICAFEGSFAAGLLEAGAQAIVEARPVLLVAYELPYPPPLSSLWNVRTSFAAAVVVAPRTDARTPQIAVGIADERLESDWPEQVAAELRMNPAAAAVPLFALLAGKQRSRAVLPYHDDKAVVVTAMDAA